jgi:hypothetical protein
MKTSQKLLRFGLIIILSLISFNSIAQNYCEKEKLDALINLSKFIDWYPYESKANKVLVIYSEGKSSINYKIQSKKDFKYKDWQIICCSRSNEIVNHSIVFITQEKKSQAGEIIKLSEKKNILLVGDNIESFCENGGMINMINRNGSTSFEINYTEIQVQNIEISTKLLTLSKIL